MSGSLLLGVSKWLTVDEIDLLIVPGLCWLRASGVFGTYLDNAEWLKLPMYKMCVFGITLLAVLGNIEVSTDLIRIAIITLH